MENILIKGPSDDYELLDSGEGEKLERFGEVILSRPDPQALWPKSLDNNHWNNIDAIFTRTSISGKWKILKEIKSDWTISFGGLNFKLELLPSKHLGVFPEQLSNWKWLEEKIKKEVLSGKKISVLNLFGYTGGASLACARAGAEICHVDASQFATDRLKENMKLSGLENSPIRIIVDDARKFVEREIKRNKKYDVILLDPPVYGKGAKKEVWKIEVDMMPLLKRLKEILSPKPLIVVLNGYATVYSHLTYKEMLSEMVSELGGKIESGQVAIKQSNNRLLPCGVFARWSKNQ